MGVEQMLGGDEPGTRFPPDLPHRRQGFDASFAMLLFSRITE